MIWINLPIKILLLKWVWAYKSPVTSCILLLQTQFPLKHVKLIVYNVYILHPRLHPRVLSVGHLQYNLTVQNCLLPGYRWIIWLLHVWYKCAHTILGHNRYGQMDLMWHLEHLFTVKSKDCNQSVSYSTGVWIIAQWVADYRTFRSINRGKNHIWSIV